MSYAILKIGLLLKLTQFEHEQEWRDAMREYAKRNIPFIALKYHYGVQAWQQVEAVLP